MNCCNDYGVCTRHKDNCPARGPDLPLVARVGRSYPAQHAPGTQIPEVSGWQAIKSLAISVAIVAVLAWVSFLLIMIGQRLGQLL